MLYKKPLPTQQELAKLFTYSDGRLLSNYSGPRRRKGMPVGFQNQYGYMVVKIGQVSYYEHRLIYVLAHGSIDDSMDLDHINGIRHDNRVENLRLVSRSSNCQNQRKAKSNNKLGLLGVSLHKSSNKYAAQIHNGTKYVRIGLYDDPATAHQAYLEHKRTLHQVCSI